ncbi:MAG TPA: DNA adenine methylase [Pirellulales bacterium]|nr:DNA adenine methylase [Pirellulales bacterium]
MKLANGVPHPIPYQGSKRFLAEEILSRMPRRFARLVEPFAGSAAISLAVASRKMSDRFWINDAHRPLADLWKAILGRPETLASNYESLWRSQRGREREFFDRVRDQFNDDHKPEHFLYLLARCVKAAIRYNSQGRFNNTPDNRRKGAKPDEMRSRILGAAGLLAGKAKVTALDYRDVLSDCKQGDLIYMDPPYQGVCATRDHRYAPKIDHGQFYGALDQLNRREFMFLVSYDGRCGDKRYGDPLPATLGLVHLELCAGRSTQATLLGRDLVTYESLYLSPALASALAQSQNGKSQRQLRLA